MTDSVQCNRQSTLFSPTPRSKFRLIKASSQLRNQVDCTTLYLHGLDDWLYISLYIYLYILRCWKPVPAISDEHEESASLTADCAATVKLEQLFRAPAPVPLPDLLQHPLFNSHLSNVPGGFGFHSFGWEQTWTCPQKRFGVTIWKLETINTWEKVVEGLFLGLNLRI